MIIHKFKEGDRVVCVEGIPNKDALGDNDGHGVGWELGHRFIITDIDQRARSEDVAWGGVSSGCGVYVNSLELISKAEQQEKKTAKLKPLSKRLKELNVL